MFDHFDWLPKVLMLPALVYALTVHEFCHAYTAVRMGDDTPRRQGRLSLNPLVHFDLIGFLLFFFAGFGWARPVQVNPDAFRNPRRDDILVSLAGRLSNLASAVLFAVLIKALLMANGNIFSGIKGDILFGILFYCIWLNLILAFFNILPIPPLDGSHILFDLLPPRYEIFKETLYRYGSAILILIVILGNTANINLLPLGPVATFVYRGLFQILQINY